MSDTPRTNFVAHESRDPEWNRSMNRFGRMKSHAEILERELATAQEELKQMRILAANPHSIQSVKDHLGPLSMWSQSGLEEHDRQILQAANAEIDALRNDAERFQWIDANCREGEGTDAWPFCVRFVTPSRFGVNMRAAIDAARKERK